MTETLKPCPFCGDKAVLKEDTRWHGAFRVECSNCDATVWATGENNPASAIAHWNTRTAPREPGEAAILAVVRELAGYGDTCFDWDTPPDGSYGNTEEDRRALWEDAAELLRRAYAVDFGAARPDAGEPGEAERLIGEWHSARCAEGLAWRATKEATNDQQHSTAVRAHEQASQRLIRAEDAMQQFAAKQVSAPRPDAGDGTGEP